MKLFLIINYSFTNRDYDRFGIQFFIDNRINVKILNLSNFDINKNLSLQVINTNKIRVLKFSDQEEFLSFSDNFKDSFIIDLRIDNLNSFFPLIWFQNQGGRLIKIEGNILPGIYASKIHKLYNLLFKDPISSTIPNKKDVIKRIGKVLKDKFVKKNSVNYDILIKTGEHKNFTKAKYIIRSHSLDFDHYLSVIKSNKKQEVFINEKIIFIDTGMCGHLPDTYLHVQGPYTYCTPAYYYPAMNRFFEKIESFFNDKIAICLHPKLIDADLVSKNYKNRKILKNVTSQAIQNCNLVISHNSTAISFAVLWNKPLLLVSTNESENSDHIGLYYLKKSLNIECFNVDRLKKNIKWDYESKKALNNYKIYKDKFIKTLNSPEVNSWKIFLDSIKDIYNLKNI